MAKLQLVTGTTSYIAQVFIQDSSSTTGAGLAALAFNSGSLTAYYHRDTDTTATVMTLVTMTVGTWTSLGFKEIDATNMPGWYQIGIPNAALASGAKSVAVHLKGATNMAPLPIEIELTAINNQDAVRAGLTALPNAAAEAAGGLFTRGTGAGQINQDANGRVDANAKAWIGGAIPAVNVTGVPLVDDKYLLGTIYSTPATAGIPDTNVKNMNNVAATAITTIKAVQGLTTADTIATYTGNTKQTGDVYAALPANFSALVIDVTGRVNAFLIGVLTSVFTEGATGRIAAAFKQFFNIATPAATMDHGILVDTVTTYTGNTVQTGDSYARLGAPAGASHAADVAAVKVDTAAVKVQTDKMAFTVTNQIDANVLDWKSATAPAMTGDAFARLGAPAGASHAADVAAVKVDTAAIKTKTDSLTFTVANQVDSNVLTGGGSGLDAAATRAALGMASANLDTQLNALPTATVIRTQAKGAIADYGGIL